MTTRPRVVGPSDIVRRVGEAFTAVQIAPDGLLDDAARAALERARELFLVAGFERLAREVDTGWVQLDVEIRREGAGDALRRELVALVEGALREGRIDRFFFMRKPPGLRLRARGTAVRRTFLPELVGVIERVGAECVGAGPYDAEVFQFGGEVGLDIAHRYFTADSIAACRYFSLPKRRTEPLVASLLSLNHLARRVCGDVFEEWDLWTSMSLAGRLPSREVAAELGLDAEFEENQDLYRRIRGEREAIVASLEEDERAIVRSMEVANEALAADLRRASSADELLYGIRKIVPFIIIFHWNRWGLDRDDQFAITYAMERLLNPKSERTTISR